MLRDIVGRPRDARVAPIEETEERGHAFEPGEEGVDDETAVDENLALVGVALEIETAAFATFAVAFKLLHANRFYLGHRVSTNP